MIKKLLPILLAVIGIGGGLGAGLLLRPAPEPSLIDQEEGLLEPASRVNASEMPPIAAEATGEQDYLELEDQFVVPVVENGRMKSLVLISLALETKPEEQEMIVENLPRLRGALLQVMFDYANIGGFDGPFTNSSRLERLRRNFFEVATSIFGEKVTDVLILEITRQDVSS